MVKWPAVWMPRKPAGKSPCRVVVKARKDRVAVSRSVSEASVVQVRAATREMSRRRQRGLGPRPAGEGLRAMPARTGATGPRFTCQLGEVCQFIVCHILVCGSNAWFDRPRGGA